MPLFRNPFPTRARVQVFDEPPIFIEPFKVAEIPEHWVRFVFQRKMGLVPVERPDERKPFSVEGFLGAIEAAESLEELRGLDRQFAMPQADAVPEKLRRRIAEAFEAKAKSLAEPSTGEPVTPEPSPGDPSSETSPGPQDEPVPEPEPEATTTDPVNARKRRQRG